MQCSRVEPSGQSRGWRVRDTILTEIHTAHTHTQKEEEGEGEIEIII